jgi:hypothetical protein
LQPKSILVWMAVSLAPPPHVSPEVGLGPSGVPGSSGESGVGVGVGVGLEANAVPLAAETARVHAAAKLASNTNGR